MRKTFSILLGISKTYFEVNVLRNLIPPANAGRVLKCLLLFLYAISLFSNELRADVTTDQLAQDGSQIIAEAYYGPGGIVSSADDVNFANTSYLVVDHNDGSTPVTYGYRWNGATATGEDLFFDVIFGTLGNPNDEEIFVKTQTFSFGTLVLGIGYNRDGDSSWGDLSDGTAMADFTDSNGILESAQTAALISANDAGDSYREGDSNFTQAWVLFDADANPYSGASANWGGPESVGFSDRVLTDGSWDGWVFDLDTTVFGDQAPGTPATTAVPEPSGLLFVIVGGITIGLRRSKRKYLPART